MTGLTATYIAAAVYDFPYQLAWKGHAKTICLSDIDAIILSLEYARNDVAKSVITKGMNLFILETSLHFVKAILQAYQMTECLICYYGISLGYLLNK